MWLSSVLAVYREWVAKMFVAGGSKRTQKDCWSRLEWASKSLAEECCLLPMGYGHQFGVAAVALEAAETVRSCHFVERMDFQMQFVGAEQYSVVADSSVVVEGIEIDRDRSAVVETHSESLSAAAGSLWAASKDCSGSRYSEAAVAVAAADFGLQDSQTNQLRHLAGILGSSQSVVAAEGREHRQKEMTHCFPPVPFFSIPPLPYSA